MFQRVSVHSICEYPAHSTHRLHVEALASLALLVLLFFALLTTSRERFREDAKQVEEELRSASDRIAAQIESRYQLTRSAAEVVIVEMSPQMAGWMMKLYGIDAATIAEMIAVGTVAKPGAKSEVPPPVEASNPTEG